MNRILALALALALTGCNNVVIDDDTHVLNMDGGDIYTGVASVAFTLALPSGVEATGQTVVVGPENDDLTILAIGENGEKMNLPAPDTYRIGWGNDGISSDGVEIHHEPDDWWGEYILPPEEITLLPGDELSGVRVYNPYFYAEGVECDWSWNGEFQETRRENEPVETIDGYRIKFRNNLGSNSWITFNGAEVSLGGDLAEVEVELDYFEFDLDGARFSVSDSQITDSFDCRW